jgi:hypothetical protein
MNSAVRQCSGMSPERATRLGMPGGTISKHRPPPALVGEDMSHRPFA